MLMHNPKEHVVEIGRRMAGRWSANTAGGNISDELSEILDR
jgi:hypothetical protein